jgi:hypothetical protein
LAFLSRQLNRKIYKMPDLVDLNIRDECFAHGNCLCKP